AAGNAQLAAEAAQLAAENAQAAAELAQTGAETAEGDAEAAQSAAEGARDLALAYADEDEDVESAPGVYSAKHWAEKAEESAGEVTSVNGQTGAVVLDAGDIGVTPAGGIAATDVQGALEELDAAGVPSGGTTGQALVKASGTDYDT